jgi:hypothetical protein
MYNNIFKLNNIFIRQYDTTIDWLIYWLVFNSNLSSISAKSWRDTMNFCRSLKVKRK